jgi:hypothetical protein
MHSSARIRFLGLGVRGHGLLISAGNLQRYGHSTVRGAPNQAAGISIHPARSTVSHRPLRSRIA